MYSTLHAKLCFPVKVNSAGSGKKRKIPAAAYQVHQGFQKALEVCRILALLKEFIGIIVQISHHIFGLCICS